MTTVKRAAFISGSGRNMGRACAKELAAAGFNIVVNGSRNRDDCERVADEVRALVPPCALDLQHRARLGVNYKQLPVNEPKCPVHSYSKGGAMRIRKTEDPVYAPNTKGGPAADPAASSAPPRARATAISS